MAEGTEAMDSAGQEAIVWEKCEVASPWVGVLSDSHDHVTLFQKAIQICNQNQVGLVLHAGDYVAPFALAPLQSMDAPYVGVFGNNDGEKIGLENRSGGRLKPGPRYLRANGRHILLVHDIETVLPPGGPPDSLNPSLDLLVHGHTHHPEIRRQGSTLFLNPGEVGGWLTGRASMALLHLETMEAKILDLAP
jgi:putative phosphoesterase